MCTMKSLFRFSFMILVITLAIIAVYRHISFKTNTHLKTKYHTRKIRSNITKRRISYRVHKNRIKYRLKKLVVKQNVTDLKKKPIRRTKSTKPVPNTNFHLNRLLYQLWDPNNYQNQGHMLNCENLISMNDKKYRQGRRFARKLNRKFYEYVNVSDIWESVKYGCVTLRNVFQYKTPKYGTASYPIAYTILLDRTAEQSLRMLASIYHHDNIYCIHPNAKFGISYLNVFKKLSECVPNIIIADNIYDIRVKTFDRLKAEISCFSKLLNSTIPWKYGINLPSSTFPLRNNTYLVQYLKSKPYENVISWTFPNQRFKKRIKYVHVVRETEGETLLLRTTTLKSAPPHGITIFRKGDYFISTRDFYNFITTSNIAKDFLDWVEDTKNPEDYFYSSLNRHQHAPFGYPYDPEYTGPTKTSVSYEFENIVDVPPSDLVVSLWKGDLFHRCHGLYRGHMCIYGAADLRWLLEQDYLFAFSFDFRVDRVAVDCLTMHLREPILIEKDIEIQEWSR